LHRRPAIEEAMSMSPVFYYVDLKRIDTFCEENQIKHINFLKIDTEGHELFVLQGAEKLISSQNVDMIQFEYGGCYLDSKTTLKEVYNFLNSKSYTIYRITGKGLIKISKWRAGLENFCYSNFLAVKKT